MRKYFNVKMDDNQSSWIHVEAKIIGLNRNAKANGDWSIALLPSFFFHFKNNEFGFGFQMSISFLFWCFFAMAEKEIQKIPSNV